MPSWIVHRVCRYVMYVETTFCLRVDLKPSNFEHEDLCLVNVNVSSNYVLPGTSKIQLNWNIWTPLKSWPLDFSGQRFGNTSLVVFLRFHSFSLIVKWPELHWYIIQIFGFSFATSQFTGWNSTLSPEGRWFDPGWYMCHHMHTNHSYLLFITLDH